MDTSNHFVNAISIPYTEKSKVVKLEYDSN